MGKESLWASLSFKTLISAYIRMQSQVVSQIRDIARSVSTATPGKFLLVQFAMSQVTQIGQSISNLIYQVNSVINNAVRNQKTQ
ncbi:MAG: hypothetical protein Tsb0015_02600 [Simkaniaceae bacterium]